MTGMKVYLAYWSAKCSVSAHIQLVFSMTMSIPVGAIHVNLRSSIMELHGFITAFLLEKADISREKDTE